MFYLFYYYYYYYIIDNYYYYYYCHYSINSFLLLFVLLIISLVTVSSLDDVTVHHFLLPRVTNHYFFSLSLSSPFCFQFSFSLSTLLLFYRCSQIVYFQNMWIALHYYYCWNIEIEEIKNTKSTSSFVKIKLKMKKIERRRKKSSCVLNCGFQVSKNSIQIQNFQGLYKMEQMNKVKFGI